MRIESSVRGVFSVFFRQFWKFFITFALVAGAAGYYAATTPPVYESVGSILVKFGNDARPDVSKNAQNQPELTPNDRRELIESYTKILQSHDLLMAIITEFGANILYPTRISAETKPDIAAEIAYNTLLKNDLIIKTGLQGNIIEIHVMNSDPRLASQVLHRLLELFITRQSDVFNRPESAFIGEQVRHAAADLEEAQKKLERFKARNGLSSVEEEMNRLLQEKSDAKTVGLKSIDEAQNKVDELKAKENQLLTTYQYNSFSVQKVHESLMNAQRQLSMRQADLRAGMVNSGAGASIAPHIKDIDKRMKLLETQRGEYNDLYRQVQIAEETYKTYVAKLEEARVKTTLNAQNITRISVLDEPTIPLAPIKPNKTLIMILGLMGGIILAFAAVLACEGMDERFSKPEQITALLGIPVMASFARAKRRDYGN